VPVNEGVYDPDKEEERVLENVRFSVTLDLARTNAFSPQFRAMERAKEEERAAQAAAEAEAKAHAALLLERRRARRGRTKHPPRPWQSAGFSTRAAWESAMTPQPEPEPELFDPPPLAPTKRERIVSRLKR
jgi:hypothetical protein